MREPRRATSASPVKVLVIDDSIDDVFFIERALEESVSFQLVGVAHDGEEAIGYLSGIGKYANRAEHPYPELILLDLKMPRQNGFEVLTWLTQQPLKPNVIVLSSSSAPKDRERAQELGASNFWVKPITIDGWKQLLASLDDRFDPRG